MKIQNNFETAFSKTEGMRKVPDKIQKSLQKLNADNTQEDGCIEVEIDTDTQLESGEGDIPGKPDTRNDKEKFDSAKNCIETALSDFKAFQDKLWSDFPELYNITKDFDGEYTLSGVYESNGKTISPIIGHEEGLNFSDFYSEDYPVISKIAAGVEKPWENIETKEEAAELLLEIINEAQGYKNDSHNSITSGAYINQGEYAAIQTVLDGLSAKDNEDINELIDICKEKLQNTDSKTVSVEEILNNYSSISSDTSKKMINSISGIEADSRRLEKLRKEYEELKSNLQDKPLTEEDAARLYDIYSEYEWTCGSMLENGGLNRNQIFSIGGLSRNNTEIYSLKSELEAILHGADTDK